MTVEAMGEIVIRGNTVMRGYFKQGAGRHRDQAFSRTAGSIRAIWPSSTPDGYIADQRPLEGHHHLGRREYLVDRGREPCFIKHPSRRHAAAVVAQA